MVELVLSHYNNAKRYYDQQNSVSKAKFAFLTLFILALAVPSKLQPVTAQLLSDAYIQVSVFVALTLLLFYNIEKWLKIDLGRYMLKHETKQIPLAAFLGALPGCGGAIIVITQYVRGYAGFGSVVAVLSSTMGDAAFVLIAREPLTGIMVMAVSIIVGSISGFIVHKIHGPEFLRPKKTKKIKYNKKLTKESNPAIEKIWWYLLIPGTILAILTAFQIELPPLNIHNTEINITLLLGITGVLLSVLLWKTDRSVFFKNRDYNMRSTSQKVLADTSFVTIFVIIGYALYEYTMALGNFDLKAIFNTYLPLIPLIAVLIGFIPGCGPQIVVCTLYVNGLIPLSAQLGNAISNDGDALFPAIAISPKASIIATLYTAIPALFVAYGYFLLFEI